MINLPSHDRVCSMSDWRLGVVIFFLVVLVILGYAAYYFTSDESVYYAV